MGTIQAISMGLLLVMGTMFLATAVGLLWWGVWPRRRGSDPHCRHCGYNLTGLQADRCPECGKAWQAETVLIGERHRRPKAVVAGIACAGIALAALGLSTYRYVSTFDPNYFKMTSSLLADMRSANALVAGRACAEVERRLGSWRTSQSQMEQFAGMVWQWQLRVRPRCVVSDGVPYELTMKETGIQTVRLTPGGYQQDYVRIYTRAELDRCWWDDDKAVEPRFSGSDSRETIARGKDALGPGRHTLHYQVRVRYLRPKPEDGAQKLFEDEIPFEATCEVLETEPPDYMTLVQGTAVGEAFRKAIPAVELILVPGPSGLSMGTISYGINLKAPVPEDAAFEVIAKVEGKEYPIGEVLCHKGQTQWHGQRTFFMRYDGPLAASADLILRGSEKLARESLDMFGTWQGDIVFSNVPVTTR